jgi:hypothetical protein
MGMTTIRVPAWKDEFPLAVTVYTPSGDIYDSGKVVVVINSATGLFQNFYAPFAK